MVWALRQAVRGAWPRESEEIEQDLDLNHATPCTRANQIELLEQDEHEEAVKLSVLDEEGWVRWIVVLERVVSAHRQPREPELNSVVFGSANEESIIKGKY